MSIRISLPQSHQRICFSHNDILDLMTGHRSCIELQDNKKIIWQSKLDWLDHSTVYLEGFGQS